MTTAVHIVQWDRGCYEIMKVKKERDVPTDSWQKGDSTVPMFGATKHQSYLQIQVFKRY